MAEPGAAAPPLVELRGLHKRFPGVRALDGVDLALRAGEVHALVGENGAGKSTLIRVLGGVHRPEQGRILLDGVAARFAGPREAARAGIATIWQEVPWIPRLSVAENFYVGRLPRTWRGVDRRAMRAGCRRALGRLGLALDVDAPIGALSLALQQLVAIARALDLDARVLVLDEPTSSLAGREVERLFALLRELRAEGLALLFVGHRLDEVLALADRVTVLRNGRRVATFPRAEVTAVALAERMLGLAAGALEALGARGRELSRGRAPGATVLAARGLVPRAGAPPCDLELRAGEVLGVAGLLGSGRSELLGALFGSARRAAGEVRVGGEPLPAGRPRAAVRRGLALCPEDRRAEGLFPSLSVRENVSLVALPRVARLGWIDAGAEARLAREHAARLEVRAEDLEQPVGTLSGGNQQKVVLARWLAARPKALLLDEPTRGIDVGARAQIEAIVLELAAEGLAVLMVSSGLDEVLRLARRALVLRAGRPAVRLDEGALDEPALLRAMAGEEGGGA